MNRFKDNLAPLDEVESASPPTAEGRSISPPVTARSGFGQAANRLKPVARQKARRGAVREVFELSTCLVLVGLLVFAGRSIFVGNARTQLISESMDHSRSIQHTLDKILTDVLDLESGARGYAISGQQIHLDQYYGAAKSLPQRLHTVRELTVGKPNLHEAAGETEKFVQQHSALMSRMVDLGNKNVFRAVGQRSYTEQGYDITKKIRAQIVSMQSLLRETMEQQATEVQQLNERNKLLMISGGMVGLLFLTVSGSFLGRTIVERNRAVGEFSGILESTPDAIVIVTKEGRIAVCNSHSQHLFGYTDQELQGQSIAILVPERFRKMQMQQYSVHFSNPNDLPVATSMELSALHKDGREFPVEITMKPLKTEKGLLVTSSIRDISKRKEVEAEITKLNQQLEQRAAEFQAANQELEAFSYSVSHDLRSPLQSIDGFSQILLEDYSEQLDAEGQDYLQRVRVSCQHMGEIIDALIVLAKMMRAEIHREEVDLSAMVQSIAQELKERAPDRDVEFVVSEGLAANCDPQLLRVVLENLLGNAWKFTSRHGRARIEFGALPQPDGERMFFIRDDGAGFDMAHAGKLFHPFKRLHDAGDFQGTGIGLATVQRVIQRHGGRICAEGAVERGATFCFTL